MFDLRAAYCDTCDWHGGTNLDGTVRAHRPKGLMPKRDDGYCDGSHEAPALRFKSV